MSIQKNNLARYAKLLYILAIFPISSFIDQGRSYDPPLDPKTSLAAMLWSIPRPIDSNHFYFPLPEPGKENDGISPFCQKWYSKHLRAMREGIIFSDTSQLEIYRFLWLRTFHNPITIVIASFEDQYALYWKQCSGAGGYDPGSLDTYVKKLIDKKVWNNFKKRLNKVDFWNMPTNDNDKDGLDGAQWILEGKIGSKYNIVDRWCPYFNKPSKKFYQCCDFLIGLTNLKFKKDEIY